MLKKEVVFTAFALALTSTSAFCETEASKDQLVVETEVISAKPAVTQKATPIPAKATPASSVQAFTARVNGDKVRMRTAPDLEGHIVRELEKGELVVVLGQQGDFYAVAPPQDLKGYIFRSFVIDNVVEGNHVNVRLEPNREAPIVGHLNTGTPIQGTICEKEAKWMQIALPESSNLFIAQEYLEYAGKRDLKEFTDKRKATLSQLFDSAHLLSKAEMQKPYVEVDIKRLQESYNTIINDYTDFPDYVAEAQQALTEINEAFLHKKIAYLEAKTSGKHIARGMPALSLQDQASANSMTATDRMKIWETVEEALFLNWSVSHHAKTINDYYLDQKLKSTTLTGIVEQYPEAIKKKPGDFLLKDGDHVLGYLYSTHVNLHELVGKRVNVTVSERPNNNFAFSAFYVLDVE